MKKFMGVVGLWLTVVAVGQADELQLADLPPVVVKCVPEAGSKDVKPTITEIRVTFSKEMTDKSWSWVKYSDESFPEIIDVPEFMKDQRTCVLKVKLEPGKTYAIWLNTEEMQNFKDTHGKPAVPYLLTFRTKEDQ